MRFLLITEARSGTHMLRGVFNNHSGINRFVDYRNDLVGIRGGLTEWLAECYSNVPDDSTAGAFTHFGELRRLSDSEQAGWVNEDWQSLRAIHDRVIRLTRKSILRRYLSLDLQVATRSIVGPCASAEHRWVRRSGYTALL